MLVAVPAAAFCKIQIDRWLVKREAEQARALQESQGTRGEERGGDEGSVAQ
jgi:hypothetical protein